VEAAKANMIPWSFTILFDEGKAQKNGYDVDTLYEYVGKNVERLGTERIGRGTWHVRAGADEVETQCRALSLLSKAGWVMQNIASLTFFEDDDEPHDFLAIVRNVNPERIAV